MALSGIGAAIIAAFATILVGHWQSSNKTEKSTDCGIKVVDEVTRNSVPNATVILEELGKVNTPKITDSEGYVYFDCPEKLRSILIIKPIGYQEYRKRVDLKPESETLTIPIPLDKQTSLQTTPAPDSSTNPATYATAQYMTRDVGDGFVSVRAKPEKESAEIKRVSAKTLVTCRVEEVQGQQLWSGNMWRLCDELEGYIYSPLLSPV